MHIFLFNCITYSEILIINRLRLRSLSSALEQPCASKNLEWISDNKCMGLK